MKAYERLIRYAKYNTQSNEASDSYPSTASQLVLGGDLLKELRGLGVEASMDDFGYVIGKIPSNTNKPVKKVAFFAHMDTSPDASGENVQPRIIHDYDGSDIILSKERNLVLSPDKFETLKRQIHHDLVVTDGLTLLGADDKAGIAEIMTVVEFLMNNPEFEHGEIIVGFTPDEEIGRGTDHLDLAKIGADVGYTLDGSVVGEINYENFNAATASITFHGKSVHPGYAKNRMVNAISLGIEFDGLLPKHMRAEATEGYEGFNHLVGFEGRTETTKVKYIIRNHSKAIFESQKKDFENAALFLNLKYGTGTVVLEIEDSYFNMRDIIDKDRSIIEFAIEATKEAGVTPVIEPIRGGTDGAWLTYRGLPCPNLGTGGYNYHGPYEYASIQEMDQCVEIVKKLIQKFL